MDKIATRIQQQDLKICDLEQRVETLEKHITYTDAAKLPPQPLPQPNTSNNTKTNANTNTNKITIKQKNDNLTPEEIMTRSKNIIGIFQIHLEDIERNKGDTKSQTLMNTAVEYLKDELGFCKEQVEEMNITMVTKTKKTDGKTLYITFQDYS